MKRSQVLLSILGGIMVIALFAVLLYQPQREALAEIDAAILAEIDMQRDLNAEIARLQSVRETAPEVEAQLALAEGIVTVDPALPAALRQLQIAADESGIVLESVATARPMLLEGSVDGLSSITVNVQLLGPYFQVVDFLRRVEDPSISTRGFMWNSSTVSLQEYPDLAVSLSGEVYAMVENLVPAPVETEPLDGEGGPEGLDAEVSIEETDDMEDAA